MRIGGQQDADRFRCLACGHQWQQMPAYQGPGKGYLSMANPCAQCGSQYSKWLNWRDD